MSSTTLILNLLCGLSWCYDHLEAFTKRFVSFPSIHDVRNELLLEELTLDVESLSSTTTLYDVYPTCPPSTPTTARAPCPAPRSGGGHRPSKGGHGAVGLLMVSLLEVAVLCGHPSTTPREIPSPCGRTRPQVLP